MNQFFVTGTDTEVGKTFISQAIMADFSTRDMTCLGFKPVASGCEETPDGLRNEDALALLASSTVPVTYNEVNPFAFKEAIAPHLAAQKAGRAICKQKIETAFSNLTAKGPDLLLVEGAGGWRLPLGQGDFMSDFVKSQQLPVILVVGMRLGCLNHACMTAELIKHDHLQVAGWVANHVDVQMPFMAENVKTLQDLLDAPFLGEVPMVSSPDEARKYLDVTPLLEQHKKAS